MNKLLVALPALVLLAACGSKTANNQASPSSSVQVTGAGSTFVYPVLSAWATDYQKSNGAMINYQSIGSGGGIAQVEAGTVDFGATDQPLESDELVKNNLAQFPVIVGGIVPVVNIPGLDAGKLKLTGPHPRRHLSGQDQELERPSDRDDQPGREPPELGDCGRSPFRRFGNDLQLHPLSQPGQPDLEVRPGRGQDGQLDRWRRRQRQ